MQKLLFLVKELHTRGFHDIRVIPSLSPSGLSWRCSFLINGDREKIEIISSNWIQDFIDIHEKADIPIERLTDKFIEDHKDSLKHCNAENKEYVDWYAKMLNQLDEGELPYAFAEYFSPGDYWKTSEDKRITTLPDEKRYYINY